MFSLQGLNGTPLQSTKFDNWVIYCDSLSKFNVVLIDFLSPPQIFLDNLFLLKKFNKVVIVIF